MGRYTDFEIVLVNDGSTDNSYQVCKKLAAENERIRVISQKNQGVSAARNVGIEAALGEYIMFVDADDWIESDMLELMMKAFHKYPIIDIAFCHVDKAVTAKDVDRAKDTHQLEIWEQQNVLNNYLHFHKLDGKLFNKMFSKELFFGLRLDTTVYYGEDRQFVYRILKRVRAITSLDETLYHYVSIFKSATHQQFNAKKLTIIKAYEEIEKDLQSEDTPALDLWRARIAYVAVCLRYEMKKAKYNSKEEKKLLKTTVARRIFPLLKEKEYSIKYKLFGIAMLLVA